MKKAKKEKPLLNKLDLTVLLFIFGFGNLPMALGSGLALGIMKKLDP